MKELVHIVFVLIMSMFFNTAITEAQSLGDSSLIKTSEIIQMGVSDTLIFAVSQSYPNPCLFKCNVDITVDIPMKSTFIIYNLVGESIYKENKPFERGFHSLEFDVSNFDSGVYFYRIFVEEDANRTFTRK